MDHLTDDFTIRDKAHQLLGKVLGDKKLEYEKSQLLLEKLALAVKVAKFGIWEWNLGSEAVIWDQMTEEIYGFKPGEFPGTTQAFSALIHSDDRDRLWEILRQAIEDKGYYVLDHRIIRLDGTTRWVQCSGTVLLDEQSNPCRIIGTILDITERKEAVEDQEFLAQASEILSSSFDYKENFALLAKKAAAYFCDGCIIDQLLSNQKLERIIVEHSDMDIRDLIFKSPQVFSDNNNEGHLLLQTLSSGKTIFISDAERVDSDLRESLGNNYVEAIRKYNCKSIIIIGLKGRASLLGSVVFFTTNTSKFKFDQRRHQWLAEELSYRISMALENSLLYINSQNAISARDEFLSIASHELKTPLTSLTLENEMRRRKLEKGTLELTSKENVTKILDSDFRHLGRINRLIEDMLDLTRIRSNKLTLQATQFGFCRFIRDVVEGLKFQLEASGCLLTLNLCEEVTINADAYRLEQALVNILTNAMKYAPGKPIKIEVQSYTDRIRVSISDEGSGIAEEDFERIFQRFERAISSNEVSGLGLGLYISRQIMERHNGTLTMTSKLGVGSVFVMELPLDN